MVLMLLTPWPGWQSSAWLQWESRACAALQLERLERLCCKSQSRRHFAPHWPNPHQGISVGEHGRGEGGSQRQKGEIDKRFTIRGRPSWPNNWLDRTFYNLLVWVKPLRRYSQMAVQPLPVLRGQDLLVLYLVVMLIV